MGAAALVGAVAFTGLLVVAGVPARPSAAATIPADVPANELLAVTIVPSDGLAPIDRRTAQVIARDAAADLQIESDALRRRDLDRATAIRVVGQVIRRWPAASIPTRGRFTWKS